MGIMMESLLLYMNLRSKQIVRVLAGIGPFGVCFLSVSLPSCFMLLRK